MPNSLVSHAPIASPDEIEKLLADGPRNQERVSKYLAGDFYLTPCETKELETSLGGYGGGGRHDLFTDLQKGQPRRGRD